jgi:hypothetical protein
MWHAGIDDTYFWSGGTMTLQVAPSDATALPFARRDGTMRPLSDR